MAVEDIETSYWKKGKECYGPVTTGFNFVDWAHGVSKLINREFALHERSNPELEYFADLEAVHFGHNVVVFRKATLEDAGVLRHSYPFPDFLEQPER